MPRKHTRLQINERKLGRSKAWGQYYDNIIEIDPRATPYQYLGTLIHELLHHCFPYMSETKVTRVAKTITCGVWSKQFRRTEEKSGV